MSGLKFCNLVFVTDDLSTPLQWPLVRVFYVRNWHEDFVKLQKSKRQQDSNIPVNKFKTVPSTFNLPWNLKLASTLFIQTKFQQDGRPPQPYFSPSYCAKYTSQLDEIVFSKKYYSQQILPFFLLDKKTQFRWKKDLWIIIIWCAFYSSFATFTYFEKNQFSYVRNLTISVAFFSKFATVGWWKSFTVRIVEHRTIFHIEHFQ